MEKLLQFDGQVPVSGHFATEKTYCRYNFHNRNKPVVITFAAWGGAINKSEVRPDSDLWGYEFVLKQGLNVIAFCNIGGEHWYRDEMLYYYMDEISKVLVNFPERLGYGGSMGGFGVLAYANSLKLDRVLVMNPISTLNNELASFETRFKGSRRGLDWQGPLHDGASCNATGYVVYDPLFNLDKAHAIRLKNLTHLKLPGVGHSMPVHLLKLGILKWLFKSFVEGEVSEEIFYRLARRRRSYMRYYNWLISKENLYLTPQRRKVIKLHRDSLQVLSQEKEAVSPQVINQLRRLALKNEKSGNIESALELMKLARMIRPNGSFIKKKISEYEEKLN